MCPIRPSGSSASDVELDRVAAQRRERQRRHEAGRRRGEQDLHVGALGPEQPEQLGGLVRGDRAGDPEADEPASRAGRVTPGPASSGSPPLTSAWRMARPLRVRSGSIDVDALERPGPRRGRQPAGQDRPDVAGLDAARVGELGADPGEQARRRAPGSRGRCPDCMAATVSRPIARSGARSSIRAASRSAPRAPRARARGPARSPRRRTRRRAATQSKVVAVPKSTTTAGVPYSRAAARALTSRSAPTSAGRSTRIGERHRAGAGDQQRPLAAARRPRSAPAVRAGTTEAHGDRGDVGEATRRRGGGGRRAAARARRPWRRRGRGRPPGRRPAGRCGTRPIVTFVLPMSTARSMAG